jgi:hypothetical protein
MNDERICSRCGLSKPTSEFPRANGNSWRRDCKLCYNFSNREKWRKNNPDAPILNNDPKPLAPVIDIQEAIQQERKENLFRKHYKDGKKKCSTCLLYKQTIKFYNEKDTYDGYMASCQLCRAHADKLSKHQRKNKIKDYRLKYYLANKEKEIKKNVERKSYRYHNEPIFRLQHVISRTISMAIKKSGNKKKGSCLDYLPYSMTELRAHIESKFEPWMNWDNRGHYITADWDDNDSSTWTWQIDHIIPQSDLPYTSMEDENFQKCWALSNLRPYSAKLNHEDGVRRTRHSI